MSTPYPFGTPNATLHHSGVHYPLIASQFATGERYVVTGSRMVYHRDLGYTQTTSVQSSTGAQQDHGQLTSSRDTASQDDLNPFWSPEDEFAQYLLGSSQHSVAERLHTPYEFSDSDNESPLLDPFADGECLHPTVRLGDCSSSTSATTLCDTAVSPVGLFNVRFVEPLFDERSSSGSSLLSAFSYADSTLIQVLPRAPVSQLVRRNHIRTPNAVTRAAAHPHNKVRFFTRLRRLLKRIRL